MKAERLTDAEERKAMDLIKAVDSRSRLGDMLVERFVMKWASEDERVGRRSRDVFADHLGRMDREIEKVASFLEATTSGYAKDALPSPKDYISHKLSNHERMESNFDELERLSLNPDIDPWSRGRLIGALTQETNLKKGVLARMAGRHGVPQELRNAIVVALADQEAADRAALMRLRRQDQPEDVRTLMDSLAHSSCEAEIGHLELATGDPDFPRSLRYALQERVKGIAERMPGRGDNDGVSGAELLRRAIRPETTAPEREQMIERVIRQARGAELAEMTMHIPVPVLVARQVQDEGPERMEN